MVSICGLSYILMLHLAVLNSNKLNEVNILTFHLVLFLKLGYNKYYTQSIEVNFIHEGLEWYFRKNN